MADRTAQEALQAYIERLGEDTGRFVKALENEVYTLRMLFEIYRALFGTNSERVDLLNAASGETAFWFEKLLFEGLVLRVCRLTDPAKSGRDATNITIRALPRHLSNGKDESLEERIELALKTTEFARDWRNRHIAHSDVMVRIGKAKLKPATRKKLSDAIDAVAACVRRYAAVELGVSLSTHPIRPLGRDEVNFLKAIYFGVKEIENRRKRKSELIDQRDWRGIDEMETLPPWLTLRPDPEFDCE